MSSSATRPAAGAVLRRGFFVVMAFVTGGASGANDANEVFTVRREHYCEETSANRHAEQSQPKLALRMPRLLNDPRPHAGIQSRREVASA